MSLKDILSLRERGSYSKIVDKYTHVLDKCRQYGQKKLGIHDKIINQTIVEGVCNIIYLEAIGNDDVDIESHFDALVDDSIAKIANNMRETGKHPYTRPNIEKSAVLDTYYKNIKYPMNIKLHPSELEILVPIDMDKQGHIYFKWVTLGEGYKLYVDTGNHAVSGMSLNYLTTRYMSSCQDKSILSKLLDKWTSAINTCGIGGVSKSCHIGYIELTFRFTNAPNKGVFTIDCSVTDTDMYDILMGDSNKPGSSLGNSNMRHLLTQNKIFLKYDVV
jgi:hypothetical protein